MTDDEWREAFDYLLSRLREVASDSSLIIEVQRATAVRIQADLAQDILFREPENKDLSRVLREELDLTKYRAPTPQEAFVAAVQVLVTRLREVPALAEVLSKLFDREYQSLQWRPDASPEEFAPSQGSFDASEIALAPEEKAQVETVLEKLETLLGMENKRGDLNRTEERYR